MPPEPSPRLLLIDDDDLSRELIELLLTEDGFAVLAFPSGEAALAHLASAHLAPGIVLTDLQMPGLHGAPLAAALRAQLPPHTRVLAMSGSTPSAATLAAFDGFLAKPFPPAALRDLLAPGILDLAAAAEDPPEPPPEAPPPVPETPVLDQRVFDELAALMRPTQLHELIALCFAEITRHARAMHQARAAADLAAFRAAAHALKGGVAMIGARELQALAATLETAAPGSANQMASLSEIPYAAARLQRILGTRGIELPPGPLDAQGDDLA